MKAWRLGDLSIISYGYTAKASHTKLGPRFLRITDIQNGTVDWNSVPTCKISQEGIEKHRLVDGDLVFARTGATTGKSYRIAGAPEAVAASYLIRVRVTKADVDTRFVELFFQTKSYWDMVMRGTSGSAQGGFNASKLAELRIPLPPLPEQKRIVAILDEAFAGIATAVANTEKNLTNARELFESYLNAVFSKQGEGWTEEAIGDFADVFDGPHATPRTVDEGPIFLGITSLQDGALRLDKTRHVTDDDFKKWTRRVAPMSGDVVFSYETRLGQAAVIPDGITCCLGRRMGLVRTDRKRVKPDFFVYQYISPVFRSFLDSQTIKGATVDRIPLKHFPSFKMSIPPLKEQQNIVNRIGDIVGGIQRIETIYDRKLNALTELKQSLLQKAFSGELTTAPQDEIETALA